MRYMTIQEWMLDYELRPAELIAFALIYGFSQDGESWYRGTAAYLAHWVGLADKATRVVLESLMEKGLIVREERRSGAIVRYDYKVAPQILTAVKTTTVKTATAEMTTAETTTVKTNLTAVETTVAETTDNNNISYNKKEKERRLPHWETFEEMQKRLDPNYGAD